MRCRSAPWCCRGRDVTGAGLAQATRDVATSGRMGSIAAIMSGYHKHPAHLPPVSRFNEPIVILVTVCVYRRQAILAHSEVHRALLSAWREAGQWTVGVYTVLPDHLHLFCTPAVISPVSIRRWVGYWKRLAGNRAGALKRAFQYGCWDTQMRNRAHYDQKLHYVRMNPVRKGLVVDWRQWPYQGEMKQIAWV